MIGQPKVINDSALIVQQILPDSIDRKGNIDELVEIRIVDDNDEPFEPTIRRRAIAVIDDDVFLRKTSVAIGVIEWEREKLAERSEGCSKRIRISFR